LARRFYDFDDCGMCRVLRGQRYELRLGVPYFTYINYPRITYYKLYIEPFPFQNFYRTCLVIQVRSNLIYLALPHVDNCVKLLDYYYWGRVLS